MPLTGMMAKLAIFDFVKFSKNHHQFESVPEINEWAIFSMHIIFSEEI